MIATIAGLALAVSSAPYNWWPCAVIGLALLYRRTESRTWKQRLRTGVIATFVMFAVGLSWTRQYSIPGWLLLSLAEALFFGLALTLVPATRGWRRSAAFAAAITLAEFARIWFPWGGLPMGGFTTGQASGPLAPSVSLFGEVGLVPLLALSAIGVAEFFRFSDAHRRLALLFLLPAVVASAIGNNVELASVGTLRVAAIQGGGEQALLRHEQDPGAVFDRHVQATARIQSPVDLIVWPEDVVSLSRPIAGSSRDVTLAGIAETQNATLLAGVVESFIDADGDRRFRNAAVVWNEEGTISGRYEKVHRVPFGEYVPFRSTFDRIADLSQVPADAIVGTGPPVVPVNNYQVGVALSYEGLFSRRLRAAANAGGELLVIPTNASSYKSSKVAATQVQAARLRALEMGRWVVQSSPTGRSAIVNERGVVQKVSTIGPSAVLQSTVELHRGQTPYARWGDLPVASISLVALFLCALAGRRSTKHEVREARSPL